MPSQSPMVSISSTITTSFRGDASLAHLFSRYSPSHSPIPLSSSLLRSLFEINGILKGMTSQSNDGGDGGMS